MKTVAITIVVAALALAGCTATGTVDSTGAPAVVPAADNLSPHQQQVLDAYVETGEISYEDYVTAEYEFFACMEASGFSVTSTEGEHLGVTQLMYSVLIPEDLVTLDGASPQADHIWDSCAERYNAAVRELYLTVGQEGAVERLLAEYTPRITACLAGYGVDVPADAAGHDIEALAWTLFEAGGTHDGPDCMMESGFALEFISPPPPAPQA